MPSIEITISMPMELRLEGDVVVACCPDLDVCSRGEDEESARRNLGRELERLMAARLERGTFEQLLEEAEDRRDLRDAEAAREEARKEGVIPWEDLKREIGL